MWEALQHTEWATTIGESRELYGLFAVVHYSAVFCCVGTIVLLDLRILGLAARNHALSSLAQQLRPVTWVAFGCAVVSGFLLFAPKAGSYVEVTPFHVKMLAIVLAVIPALVVEWRVPKWDLARAMPMTATLLALMSIVLWLGAVLAAVEILTLTGLG